ncbi:MAG: glycosyltransferase family 39 protein [Acidobacteriia bacterium]|nr:glycosyltransferase family 39 protein [Terriglobia bacterium]
MSSPAGTRRKLHPALVFALILLTLVGTHLPLLRLPYIWDEAGYYIPAARDLLLTGSVIPHSTPSNAHPPLVMAYLALCWKVAGYAPMVTRCAVLVMAAFSLLGLFRLAETVANFEVATASTLCTAFYSVFFTQSSLAHVDLAAAGLTFWALHAYAEDRRGATAFWLSLAVLAKETAILAPLALFLWERLRPVIGAKLGGWAGGFPAARISKSALLLVPLVPLGLWYAYHYRQTGFVFGNPEFFRYNVQATLQPLRAVLALLIRLWQALGYLNLYLLSLAALFAMWLPAVQDEHGDRPRIAVDVQFGWLAVIVAYLLAMAVVGGAELARYMLPAVPLVIVIFVSTLWRRVRLWRGVIAIVILGFVAGLLTNPRYGISLEDNLAYRDYIVLHQHAEEFTEARYPMARVLTAWPASDELTRPYLGYLSRPMRVVRIDDFTIEQLMSAADLRSSFEVALVFSTKYEPQHPLFEGWRTWQEWKTRYFGYHRDVPPAAAARILGGQLVYSETRDGQWVGVIEMEQVVDARLTR